MVKIKNINFALFMCIINLTLNTVAIPETKKTKAETEKFIQDLEEEVKKNTDLLLNGIS